MLKKTQLTITEHQLRTVKSYLTLMDLDPDIPWTPVIQGFSRDDYMRCIELYTQSGIDLRSFEVVGLGSICRRQGTCEVAHLIREIHGMGIALHGFGLKTKAFGNKDTITALASSDSMAWSFAARYRPPRPGCITHKNCANCYLFARDWHQSVLEMIGQRKPLVFAAHDPRQLCFQF